MLSGLLFAMVVSFDELIVSLFVSTARIRPVPVQMWSNLRGDFDPTIAAIASLCFVFALVALLLEMALRRRTGTREAMMSATVAWNLRRRRASRLELTACASNSAVDVAVDSLDLACAGTSSSPSSAHRAPARPPR